MCLDSLLIEEAKPDYLAEMQRLFVDTISSVCRSDYNPQQIEVWTSSVEDKERWDDIFQNQDVFVAKCKGQIVGFATLKDKNHIDLFYVHKDFQGRNVATKLYAVIENKVLLNKWDRLTSNVSITAKGFFQKMGFEVITEQTVTREDVVFTNYRMRKELKPIAIGDKQV